ncbi:uncharacterized protein [Montipora capricornis]|uniref:uncharacterized protein n=1 Tax=Montipora capricornis TaxID=246305 RepID=UPI0035F1B82D
MNPFLQRTLASFCSFPQLVIFRSCSSTSRQQLGRQFEEIVVENLRKFSLDVAACGGARDRGIDFRGIWRLKSCSVRVIGQCKRFRKRLGPRFVRELEGSLTHEAKNTLGIIVSESGYTKDAYEVFIGSLYPIALATLIGYSDDILQWYSSNVGNEQGVGKRSDAKESDTSLKEHCSSRNNPLLVDNEDVCYGYSNIAQTYNQGISEQNSHQYLAEDDKEINKTLWRQHNPELELDNFDKLHILATNNVVHSRNGLLEKNDSSQLSGFSDATCDVEQLAMSDITEIGRGTFTMFELNPFAQKQMPNVVVGTKYHSGKFKSLELFISEHA